jgi:hypothetical protein
LLPGTGPTARKAEHLQTDHSSDALTHLHWAIGALILFAVALLVLAMLI